MNKAEGQVLPLQGPTQDSREVYDPVMLQMPTIAHFCVRLPLDLSPLKENPNLKKLVLQECPGLMLVPSNFETLNYLKAKGVVIILTDTPEFEKAYADYCLSHTAENVLPHAIVAASPESAVLQGPNAQNQSTEKALPSYSTNHTLS